MANSSVFEINQGLIKLADVDSVPSRPLSGYKKLFSKGGRLNWLDSVSGGNTIHPNDVQIVSNGQSINFEEIEVDKFAYERVSNYGDKESLPFQEDDFFIDGFGVSSLNYSLESIGGATWSIVGVSSTAGYLDPTANGAVYVRFLSNAANSNVGLNFGTNNSAININADPHMRVVFSPQSTTASSVAYWFGFSTGITPWGNTAPATPHIGVALNISFGVTTLQSWVNLGVSSPVTIHASNVNETLFEIGCLYQLDIRIDEEYVYISVQQVDARYRPIVDNGLIPNRIYSLEYSRQLLNKHSFGNMSPLVYITTSTTTPASFLLSRLWVKHW